MFLDRTNYSFVATDETKEEGSNSNVDGKVYVCTTAAVAAALDDFDYYT